jgi:hypothetical protein
MFIQINAICKCNQSRSQRFLQHKQFGQLSTALILLTVAPQKEKKGRKMP